MLHCYQKRHFNLSEYSVVGFLAYMSVTTLWSGEPYSLFLYFGYGLLLIAFLKSFALVQALNFDVFWGFRLSLIISAVFSASVSIYIFTFIEPSPSGGRLQAMGGLYNPVVGALSYGAALIFTYSALVDTQSRVAKLLLFTRCLHTHAGNYLYGHPQCVGWPVCRLIHAFSVTARLDFTPQGDGYVPVTGRHHYGISPFMA